MLFTWSMSPSLGTELETGAGVVLPPRSGGRPASPADVCLQPEPLRLARELDLLLRDHLPLLELQDVDRHVGPVIGRRESNLRRRQPLRVEVLQGLQRRLHRLAG